MGEESKTAEQKTEQVQLVQKENKSSPLKFKIIGFLDVLFGFFVLLMAAGFYLTISQVLTLYEELNIKVNLLFSYLLVLTLIVIGGANLFIGVKNLKTSINKFFNLGVISIIASFFLLGILSSITIGASMKQFYNLTTDLDVAPSVTPKKFIKLSDAWSEGIKTYSNSKIDISFNYPSYLQVNEVNVEKKNKEWAEKYKNDPNVRQPLYNSSFAASFFTPKNEVMQRQDYVNFCNNKMTVSVSKFDNAKKLSLYNFIAELNKIYPGDGLMESFETFSKTLSRSSLPKEDSYLFEGIVGENPVKEVYFDYKGKVYNFHLIGNCDTGNQYSEDAEKVFEDILKSVKFTDQNQVLRINNQDIRIVERKTKIYNFSNWKLAKDSSGYRFSYPNNWFIAFDDRKNPAQVQNWDPSKVENPGAPMTDKMAKWDISFLKKNYTNIKDVLMKEEDDEIELIEETRSATEKEIYFVQGTAPFFENRTARMPYIDAIIIEDDKYFVWHGYYSRNEDLKTLKIIAESL